MGKQVFFHSCNKYQRKLEPFRRVQRHHLNTVFVRVGLTLAGIQRRTIKKGLQRANGLVLWLEEPCRSDQLLKILHSGLAPLALFGAVIVKQTCHVDRVLGEFVERKRLGRLIEVINQRLKIGQCGERSRWQQRAFPGEVDRPPHWNLLRSGDFSKLLHRLAADTPRRRIEHSLKCGVIFAGLSQTQVGKGVANFQALVKTLATVNPVGNTLAQQCFLKDSRLSIRSIQNRDRATRVAVTGPLLGLLNDVPGFILLIEPGI